MLKSNGAVVIGGNNAKTLIETETVILTAGTRPNTTLYQQIKSLGYETHRIGDCLEARNAKEAIYEGALLGRRL